MDNYTKNGYGGSKHENDSTQKSMDQFNNTLDFYNDDMSRNAAKKLFGAADEEIPAKVPQRHSHTEGASEEDIVKGFEKAPAAPARSLTRPLAKRSDNFEDEDKDAQGYNFSLYRKKDKRDSGWGAYNDRDEDDAPKPIKQAKLQPPDIPVSGTHTEVKPSAPSRAQGQYTKIERPIRSPYPGPARPHPAAQKPPQARPGRPSPYDSGEDDVMGGLSSVPIAKLIGGGVALAVVVLLVVLSVQLNAAKGSLAEAVETAASFDAIRNDLVMRNEAQEGTIAQLQQQVADLQAQLDMLNPPVDVAEDDAGADIPGHNGAASSEGRVHVVQSGDNLGKISQLYYGRANLASFIQEANNISDPTKIQAGQELVIPPMPQS